MNRPRTTQESSSLTVSLTWTKLPLVGMPGMECGKQLVEGGETFVVQAFKDEFGPCDDAAHWMAGMLLLCPKHAADVAQEFGDNLPDIEAAWHEQLRGSE